MKKNLLSYFASAPFPMTLMRLTSTETSPGLDLMSVSLHRQKREHTFFFQNTSFLSTVSFKGTFKGPGLHDGAVF